MTLERGLCSGCSAPSRCPPPLVHFSVMTLKFFVSFPLSLLSLLRKMAELVRLKIKRPHQLNTSEKGLCFHVWLFLACDPGVL